MASWKKVIVSGSNANLATLQVDNLTNGFVTGSANGTLGIAPVNGTGSVVLTTNATGLVHSGSFSGSFAGSLTGTSSYASTASYWSGSITNALSASFASTASLPLLGIITASVNVSTITFTKGDASQFSITLSTGSATSAASVTITNTGSNGTLWYPTFVVSGSNTQSLYVNSGSFSYNAATNTLTVTASYVTGSIHTSTNPALSASYASSSTSASYATTASYWSGSITNALSASYATTASYALNITPIATGSFATTGSNTFIGTETISGSLVITGSASLTGSLNILGTVSASGYSGSLFGTASWAISASQAVSSAFASTAATANQLANALTFGVGVSGSAASYNGSAAVTVAISGSAALTQNNVPKWSGTGLQNSSVSDNGTTVTIATSASISAGGLTIVGGGANVTGNSTFQNNLTVQGDLAVNGTTTFINTTNTYIKDQFLLLYSGSNALGDGGIIVQYSTGSGGGPTGSALFLESTSTSTYGRWAVAYGVGGADTAVTANEYMITTIVSASTALPVAPTWGGSTTGHGNMYVNSTNGDIYIYS